jgi:hypothetical protein
MTKQGLVAPSHTFKNIRQNNHFVDISITKSEFGVKSL